MQVQFYKTRNELLKPFLEGYYFLSKRELNDVVYFTFPNNLISVSVYKHHSVTLQGSHAVIAENLSVGFNSVLISNYKLPLRVSYCGCVDEITFSFKPSGLNWLLPNFSIYLKNQLNKFIPFDDFEGTMNSVLNEPDIEKRILTIESYWLSKLNKFENNLLVSIIDHLSSVENDMSIADLALKHSTSRQNICKLFSKYVGKSPNDFKKINRFRFALSKKLASLKEDKNLTSISYESLFYDQSHMIKEFKMLTGLTPKQFFNQTDLKAGAGTWLFDS